jgi:arabinogalactan oligomer / maltooligosaccharide transport system substrate-binding protein
VSPRPSSATLVVRCFFMLIQVQFTQPPSPRFTQAAPGLRRAVCALLILVLVGCATAAPAQTDPTSAPAVGAVTLVLWHGWAGSARQALGRLVERYNRQQSNGRVTLQSIPLATFDGDLRTALTYGGGPHMVLVPNTWIGSLVERDALLAIDDQLKEDQAALLPAAIGGARAKGADGTARLYGLPVSFDTLALFYNTANVLTPPADTDALIRSAHGLSDPNAPRWGLAVNLSFENTIGYLYAAGGRVFGDDGTVVLGDAGRAGAEQWLAWLLQLQSDPRLMARADNSIQIDRALKDGHVLMAFDWAHQIGLYRSLWGENLGVSPLPRLSPGNGIPQPYVKTDVLAINGRVSAGERAVALDFLRFMTSAEAQAELLRSDLQPARADVPFDSGELGASNASAAAAFRAQAQQGRPMPNTATREREIVRRELSLMQQQVLRGEAAPADAVTEADRRLREQLAVLK